LQHGVEPVPIPKKNEASCAGLRLIWTAGIVFDFFHHFAQNLAIIEVSKTHPEGLRLCFRPISMAREILEKVGFGEPEFRPFTLPIDLPRYPDDSELITYTVTTSDSRRLPFRRALFQPWCHLSAIRVF
jgi:hypothetical protein